MTLRRPRSRTLPAFCLLTACLAGCGDSYRKNLAPPESDVPDLAANTEGAAKKRDPLVAANYDGILSGQVTLAGARPAKVQVVGTIADCLRAEKSPGNEEDIYNPNWLGEGNTVRNVVVFLKAPDGKFFPIDGKVKRPDAALDQPYCAFHPQVVIMTPVVLDKKGTTLETGQKLLIKNSGVILHNANLAVFDPRYNSGFNESVGPGKVLDKTINPQPTPLGLSCSVHPWMRAHLWAFDHPYVAKTNDQGEFKIENLPTGINLQVVFWHPAVGFFGEGGEDGVTMKFNPGENNLSRTITPK